MGESFGTVQLPGKLWEKGERARRMNVICPEAICTAPILSTQPSQGTATHHATILERQCRLYRIALDRVVGGYYYFQHHGKTDRAVGLASSTKFLGLEDSFSSISNSTTPVILIPHLRVARLGYLIGHRRR